MKESTYLIASALLHDFEPSDFTEFGRMTPDPRTMCQRVATDALGNTHGIPLEELYATHLRKCEACRLKLA